MDRPLIAVIGDSAKCTKADVAKQAGYEVGRELAKLGCRLLVYSSLPQFIECNVVAGYLTSGVKLEDRSIEVRYPPEFHALFTGEKDGDPIFVRTQLAGDWEALLYPSFAELDGLIVIGGGPTAKRAGFLAMGSQTPFLLFAGLGGAAKEVWNYLPMGGTRLVTSDDRNLMASAEWHSESAARFTECLFEQMKRKADAQRDIVLGASERQRKTALTMLAVIGSALFLIVLLTLAYNLPPKVTALSGFLLFGTPAIAGASGAAVRVLWDNWQQHEVPLELRPILMTVVLGFWASGVAALLFVLPQIWIAGDLQASQYYKLASFAVPVGILAGLTLDRVFPKLLKTEIPINTRFLTDHQDSNPTSATEKSRSGARKSRG